MPDELTVMQQCHKRLMSLDAAARWRALRWLNGAIMAGPPVAKDDAVDLEQPTGDEPTKERLCPQPPGP